MEAIPGYGSSLFYLLQNTGRRAFAMESNLELKDKLTISVEEASLTSESVRHSEMGWISWEASSWCFGW